MMKRRRFCMVLGSAASMLIPGGGAAGAVAVSRHEMTAKCFGAAARIVVLCDSRKQAMTAMQRAFQRLEHIESVMSIYRPESQLSVLNREGHLRDPDPMFRQVLRHAHDFSMLTESAFDITVQPLWEVYQAAVKRNALPDDQVLRAARRRVGFERVVVREDAVTLKHGAQITLNGIAQGFATDEATRVLRDHGIRDALLDLGELSGIGSKAEGQRWKAGIQHPRSEDAYAAVVDIDNRCLATSGDYHTSFSLDYRHHHILDPQTGRSPTELSSVSVLAPTATEADAISTALMVLNGEQRSRLLAKRPDIDVMCIGKNGQVFATSGFPSRSS